MGYKRSNIWQVGTFIYNFFYHFLSNSYTYLLFKRNRFLNSSPSLIHKLFCSSPWREKLIEISLFLFFLLMLDVLLMNRTEGWSNWKKHDPPGRLLYNEASTWVWELGSRFYPLLTTRFFPILTSDERACHFLVVVLSGFTNWLD